MGEKYTADEIAELRKQNSDHQQQRLSAMLPHMDQNDAQGAHARFVYVLNTFEDLMINESERGSDTTDVTMAAAQMIGALVGSLVSQSAKPGAEQMVHAKIMQVVRNTSLDVIGQVLIEKIAKKVGIDAPQGDFLQAALKMMADPRVQAAEQKAKASLGDMFGGDVKVISIGPDGVTGDVAELPEELRQMLGIDAQTVKRTLN